MTALMAIDPSVELPLAFSELGRAVNYKVGRNTVREWAEEGRVSTSGNRVYLEWIMMPWGRATTVEAYYRFLDRLNE